MEPAGVGLKRLVVDVCLNDNLRERDLDEEACVDLAHDELQRQAVDSERMQQSFDMPSQGLLSSQGLVEDPTQEPVAHSVVDEFGGGC